MNRARLSPTPRPLHVLCACDTFKGTLPSDKVGEAVEAGYRQVWKKLHESGNSALPTSAGSPHRRSLPPVSIPSTHSTHDDGLHARQSGPMLPAAGLLAFSLFSVHPTAGSGAGTAELRTQNTVPIAIPADFVHTPMSDGGAGLIDSVTFAASLEAQGDASEKNTTASATTNTLAATTASAAGAAATFHAPPQPSDALHLRRVYVPASVVITGPLGTPLEHTQGAAGAAGELPSTSAAAGPAPASLATTGTGVSFACDVARRVLVIEMAEAAGLPRIARPQDRNPARTTSYGVGELIRYALAYMEGEIRGSKDGLGVDGGVRLFLGIGGSSTNDGGLGALQALGLEIYVQQPSATPTASATAAATAEGSGVLLKEPFRGADLNRITHVRLSEEMLRLFPYLRPSAEAEASGKASGLHVAEVCLICDVDNTLVGPRGATYTFGPQKCAPPPPPAARKDAAAPADASPSLSSPPQSATGDDAAVGAITSAAQKSLLDSLEAGMRHAATRVVSSTWRQLVQSTEWPRLRASAAAVAADDLLASAKAEGDDEAAVWADLLYRPGGGGAGGMSGFFRYLLRASYVPGADMVGGLLGLYETPHVAHLLGSNGDAASASAAGDQQQVPLGRDRAAVQHPRGCLFHSCDVVVSGEGSFDHQTISSHKTVGRLLEMCTAANAYRLWRYYCHPTAADAENPNASTEQHHADGRCRTIEDFIVVCGRTSFDDYVSCQSSVLQSVCDTLTPPEPAKAEGQGLDTMRVNLYLQDLLQSPDFLRSCDVSSPSAADILRHCCVPRVTVLPLTPTLFSFTDATQKSYACVSSAVVDLLEDSVARLVAKSQKASAGS